MWYNFKRFVSKYNYAFMHIVTYILIFVIILFILWWIFLHVFSKRIEYFEWRIIQFFTSRTDVFPALYEVSKTWLARHEEIFKEILELRKKEFSLTSISQEIESFIEFESKIHHELNFIFQVCNKNPKLIKDGRFLYIRDIVMEKSVTISQEIKKYRKIIQIYNKCIQYKNYSLIWLLIPFTKKASI